MNQYQDRNILPNASLRDRAKGALTNRFGEAVLAFFLVWLISAGISFVSSFLTEFILNIIKTTKEILTSQPSIETLFEMLQDPSYLNDHSIGYYIANIVLSAGVSIILCVFKVGLSLYCLNLACGRGAKVSDIFFGFSSQFGKSLKLAAVYTLVQEIFFVPFELLVQLSNLEISAAVLAVLLILTIGGLVLSFYLLLHVSQCFFLLLDFPGYSAMELLRLSSHVMEGHKKRLLMLMLSFVPLFILSMLTFGVGLLWVNPYLGVAKTFFFLNLMQARNQNS